MHKNNHNCLWFLGLSHNFSYFINFLNLLLLLGLLFSIRFFKKLMTKMKWRRFQKHKIHKQRELAEMQALVPTGVALGRTSHEVSQDPL